MKTLIALVIAGLLAAPGALSQGTAQKTGFVNSAKIFKELPEAQEAQNRIDAQKKQAQDELEKKQAELQAKAEEYQKKESMMNDAAKRAAQQEFQDLQGKARDFAQAQEQELVKMSEKLLEPIREKVLRAIERVAKAEKYTFIFDRTEAVTVLLYGDQAHDLTFKVIDALKRGK